MKIEIVSTILSLTEAILAIKLFLLSYKYRYLLGFYKIFSIIAIAGFIQIFYSQILSHLFSNKLNPLLYDYIKDIYIIIEFLIFLFFFYTKFFINSNKKSSKFLIFFALIIILILIIKDPLFITNNYSTVAGVEAIIFLTFSTVLFAQIINNDSVLSLFDSTDFIITSGIFFFFSFTFPYYILDNYLDELRFKYFPKIDYINIIAYILLYSFLLIALKCEIRIKKSLLCLS